MPKPKDKKKNDPLKKFRKFREKERQNYRDKNPSKSEYEIQNMINENKRKAFGKVLEKRKKPPKTAMDSVSTMPRKMKADTMKQMKKKDMMYGGRKMESGRKPTTAKKRISNIDKMMTSAPSDSKKRLAKRKASLQKQVASKTKPIMYGGGKKKPMTYGGKKMRYGGMKKGKKC